MVFQVNWKWWRITMNNQWTCSIRSWHAVNALMRFSMKKLKQLEFDRIKSRATIRCAWAARQHSWTTTFIPQYRHLLHTLGCCCLFLFFLWLGIINPLENTISAFCIFDYAIPLLDEHTISSFGVPLFYIRQLFYTRKTANIFAKSIDFASLFVNLISSFCPILITKNCTFRFCFSLARFAQWLSSKSLEKNERYLVGELEWNKMRLQLNLYLFSMHFRAIALLFSLFSSFRRFDRETQFQPNSKS